jgi:hypothetical protein
MIVYAKFEVSVHGLRMTKDEVEFLGYTIEKLVKAVYPHYDLDSDVEVELVETAGTPQ